jgi:hypothetical protein
MPLFLVLTWLAVVFGAAGAVLQLAAFKLKPQNPQLGFWARSCFIAMALTIVARMIIMLSS